MTRQEFDTWLEAHYADLRKVARRMAPRDRAEDVLHAAIAGMLASPGLATVEVSPDASRVQAGAPMAAVWPWARSAIRGAATHAAVSAQRKSGQPRPLRVRETMRGQDRQGRIGKLSPEARGIQAADDYYLERLEEDRRDFDMDGYFAGAGQDALSADISGEGQR